MSDANRDVILDTLKIIQERLDKIDEKLQRLDGISLATKTWADETVLLHERYRETLGEVSDLGRRVRRLEGEEVTVDERSNGSGHA